MKVVINKCFGGFSISKEAAEFIGVDWDGYGFMFDQDRSNPKLVECIEALGKEANGKYADLKVVEIPDGTDYLVEEYDGREWISERHQTWG